MGRAELWLPGVTAVVRRGRRAAPGGARRQRPLVAGHRDPRAGRGPGAAAAREALEETGVQIRVDRLASVTAGERVTHANGDRAVYLDHTFACTWLAGEARVADDESTAVGWFHRDRLPEMNHLLRARIDAASGEERARFRV